MNQKFNYTHPALTDENDEPIIYKIGGKMEVCPTCQGYGHHVRRDIDDSRLVDNMMEDGDDEGLEAYYRGGFDCVCTQCDGSNVVFIPNLDELPESVWTKIRDYEEGMRECQRINDAERRMGA